MGWTPAADSLMHGAWPIGVVAQAWAEPGVLLCTGTVSCGQRLDEPYMALGHHHSSATVALGCNELLAHTCEALLH